MLNIKADIDDDGTAGLFVGVENDGFSGHGEAWFNLSEIKDFAQNLKYYANSFENPPSLIGGYFYNDGKLKDILMSFDVYDFGDRGYIGIFVYLEYHPFTDCRKHQISKVSTELLSTSEQIIKFADDLCLLIDGNIDEAILHNAT